jgi:hypothetical protein
VKSRATETFWKLLNALPSEIREQAGVAYRMFRANPRHPGLHFKRVHGSDQLVAVRVGRSYRAVGIQSESDEIVWFWIGPHDEYERIIYSQ